MDIYKRKSNYFYGVAINNIRENEYNLDTLERHDRELQSIMDELARLRVAVGKDRDSDVKKGITAVCRRIRAIKDRNKNAVARSFRYKDPVGFAQMMTNFPDVTTVEDLRERREARMSKGK